MAISLKVWPCDLLMVMAKAGRTGNWRRRIWMGMVLSSALEWKVVKEVKGNDKAVLKKNAVGGGGAVVVVVEGEAR